MRTTIDIDDDLFSRAKEAAARTNRPLRAVIEDALRESLSRDRPGRKALRVRLPVSSKRGGLCEGVDLDNSADLLDLMERPDAPR
jgi:hypothetical protein